MVDLGNGKKRILVCFRQENTTVSSPSNGYTGGQSIVGVCVRVIGGSLEMFSTKQETRQRITNRRTGTNWKSVSDCRSNWPSAGELSDVEGLASESDSHEVGAMRGAFLVIVEYLPTKIYRKQSVERKRECRLG